MMPAKAARPAPSANTMVKELRHADADHARHVGIVDAGADHGAEPRAVEQQPEPDGDHRGDDDDRQAVHRKCHRADADKSAKPGGCGDVERVAAPHQQAEIGGHERQAERHQHLRQLIAGQAAQQQPFGQCAARGHDQRCQDRRQPEIQLKAEHAHDEGGADIGAQHEQRAVRQIRNPHQPEDQGEARRQQKQQSAERDAVDRQHQPKSHNSSVPKPVSFCIRTIFFEDPFPRSGIMRKKSAGASVAPAEWF